LPETDCTADIYSRSLEDSSDIADQHSILGGKSASDKTALSGLHILPDGMCWCAMLFGSLSAQDRARETGLAFGPLMR
jgi:hypothetical protein